MPKKNQYDDSRFVNMSIEVIKPAKPLKQAKKTPKKKANGKGK